MPVIALIPTDLQTGRLGTEAYLGKRLGRFNILSLTLHRAASIKQISKIVVVHRQGESPAALLEGASLGKPVEFFAAPSGLEDPQTASSVAARKWALTAWRGGLGAATCYDELLPPGPLVAAMAAHQADVALIVRGDWCLFDPTYACEQLKIYLSAPEAMKISFTQAPPGLSALVAGRSALQQLHENQAGLGQILGYNWQKPNVDPISREVNYPIPASVRDCDRRFIFDTPRAMAVINAVSDYLGDALPNAGAVAITDAVRQLEGDGTLDPFSRLPQQVTLELTPRRQVSGPIVAQHHVTFDRADMDTDLAERILVQLGEQEAAGDVALMLGGLGDAMLHPQFEQLVRAARSAGVLGIGVQTDLLCEQDELAMLLELPLDLITVGLNADNAETYQQTMGVDSYKQVLGNLEWLFNQRVARSGNKNRSTSLPWIVPRLVKTEQTLEDMETFFERWMRISGHAIIEPAQCGCGLMPAQSPVPMEPPLRRTCRQLRRRMSILSNGQVALCDQDWQGRGALGDATIHSLIDIWRKVRVQVDVHDEGRYAELTLCGDCVEWHRP
jgi:spore coat polysaccharide biosynthesis protein SpsF (cytidylyltransferase family)